MRTQLLAALLLIGSSVMAQDIDAWYEHNPGHPLHTDMKITATEDASGYSAIEITFACSEGDTTTLQLDRCTDCAKYENTYATGTGVLGSYKFRHEEKDANVTCYLVMCSEADGSRSLMLIEETAEGWSFNTYVFQLIEKR